MSFWDIFTGGKKEPQVKRGLLGEPVTAELFGETRVELEDGSAKVTKVDEEGIHFKTGGDIFGTGEEHWFLGEQEEKPKKEGGDWLSKTFGPGADLIS